MIVQKHSFPIVRYLNGILFACVYFSFPKVRTKVRILVHGWECLLFPRCT